MVAAVGIIPVSLDLLRWNEDVSPVFPAQRVDAFLDSPYLRRVAVGVAAASQHRIVRHVPTRIELARAAADPETDDYDVRHPVRPRPPPLPSSTKAAAGSPRGACNHGSTRSLPIQNCRTQRIR